MGKRVVKEGYSPLGLQFYQSPAEQPEGIRAAACLSQLPSRCRTGVPFLSVDKGLHFTFFRAANSKRFFL